MTNALTTRLLAICGIVAPIFYVVATQLTVDLRPDYSLTLHTASQLSDLDQPYGLLFILAGAAPVGVLMMFFAYSIWVRLPDSTAMNTGVVLLSLEGMAIVVAYGVFPRSGPSPGVMHLGAGLIALAVGLAGRLLLARPLQTLASVYFPFTVAVAIAIPLVFLGAVLISSTPGLYERVAHAIAFTWMLAIAVPLLIRPVDSSSDDPVPIPDGPE